MNDVALSFFLFFLLTIRAFGPVCGSQLGVAWRGVAHGDWNVTCFLRPKLITLTTQFEDKSWLKHNPRNIIRTTRFA
jgi:hypothetical protein